MDAIFIDNHNNRKNFLYQYDKGQSLLVENCIYTTAPKIQYSISTIPTTIAVQSSLNDGSLIASIPDTLLTTGEDIIAYVYLEEEDKSQTVDTIYISVRERKRPSDYVYSNEMFTISINGMTITDNSNFAEVFEWSDANPDSEDRCGYFVTVCSGAVIQKALSMDNVLGVTIKNPGFATNCNESKLSSDGTLLSKYSYVCSLGCVSVVDNGTCSVGGRCVPSNNGNASPSSEMGYYVIDRIDDTHILILLDRMQQSQSSGINVESIPFIDGTQTEITALWTGVANTIDELYDGLTIRYWLPYDCDGAVTINLSLKNGTLTGPIDCYYRGTTRLGVQFPAGSLILLTYRENVSINGSIDTYTGWWATSDYNGVSGTSSGSGTASNLILTDEVTGEQYKIIASNAKLYLEVYEAPTEEGVTE